jgi:hypothetical protein
MASPDHEMKTPISRASDKLANDLIGLLQHDRWSGTETVFRLARATITSMEHLVRVVVRDEIAAWDTLHHKDDEPPPRKRKSFADDAVEQALKTGLRRVASWIEDVEERL